MIEFGRLEIWIIDDSIRRSASPKLISHPWLLLILDLIYNYRCWFWRFCFKDQDDEIGEKASLKTERLHFEYLPFGRIRTLKLNFYSFRAHQVVSDHNLTLKCLLVTFTAHHWSLTRELELISRVKVDNDVATISEKGIEKGGAAVRKDKVKLKEETLGGKGHLNVKWVRRKNGWRGQQQKRRNAKIFSFTVTCENLCFSFILKRKKLLYSCCVFFFCFSQRSTSCLKRNWNAS